MTDPNITELVSAVESSLADIVQALEKATDQSRLQGIEHLLSAIEGGIADLAEAAQHRIDFTPLIAALKGVKPPTVHVAAPVVNLPAIEIPAPIIQFLPQQNNDMRGATWQVTLPGMYGEPGRTMTITRTA